jgi:hypothetical protein
MRDRVLAAVLIALCGCLVLGAVTQAQTSDPTPQVSDVTPTTAQVTATVEPPGDVGSYRFEWGTDTTFEHQSDPIALGIEPGVRSVGGTLTGLMPATTYLVRVVVTGDGDPVVSQPATFTTPPETGTGAGEPPTTTTTTPDMEPMDTPETAPPDPEDADKGEAVVVGTESGTVTVKQEGTEDFATLAAGAPIPVGSIVDATEGTVRLISEVTASGRTQDVLLRGAMFEVRQSPSGDGTTELVLRGGDFSACGRASSAQTRKKKPRRSLWARDRGGKFRTRGINSVATVRGTTWRTTDTCTGTTTSVTKGSVVVRELRSGRRIVVRAGHKHLARAKR